MLPSYRRKPVPSPSDWAPSVPEQGAYPSFKQAGKGYAGGTSEAGTPLPTTFSPRFTPASIGLTPGRYLLTVTVTSADGAETRQAQATVTLAAADLARVKVYPNPWRSDKHAAKEVMFANLPANSSVKIFTASGHLTKDLGTASGTKNWDLTNDAGDKVSSGIYVYLIKDGEGNKVKGKVAVIR